MNPLHVLGIVATGFFSYQTYVAYRAAIAPTPQLPPPPPGQPPLDVDFQKMRADARTDAIQKGAITGVALGLTLYSWKKV